MPWRVIALGREIVSWRDSMPCGDAMSWRSFTLVRLLGLVLMRRRLLILLILMWERLLILLVGRLLILMWGTLLILVVRRRLLILLVRW